MPLRRGSSKATISANIKEFAHGKTFGNTAATHGRKVAVRQAIAVALKAAGKKRG